MGICGRIQLKYIALLRISCILYLLWARFGRACLGFRFRLWPFSLQIFHMADYIIIVNQIEEYQMLNDRTVARRHFSQGAKVQWWAVK